MSPPAAWTNHLSGPFDAIPRVDPYLVWAEAMRYRDFGDFGDFDDAGDAFAGRIPVAIELKRGACTAQSFARLIDSRGWNDSNIADELTRVIERFTLGVPNGTDKRVLDMKHETIAPAPVRDDIGRVIVGVCDDDIAFAHRRFFEDASGMRTRFQCFWNQDDQANNAAGLGYGSELLKTQMDERLRRAHRVGQASHEEGVYRIADYAGHAPVIDDEPHLSPLPLIGVQFGNARCALRDAAGLRLDVQALDAVRYIVKRAQDTCGSACHALVNLSYGQLSGPRDGSSLIESALDELMDTGACSIVMPSGNRHLSRCHGAVTIVDETPLRWRVPHDSDAPSFVEIWFPANAPDPQVDVRITPPDGTDGASSAWIRRGEYATLADDGDTFCTVVHRGRGARGDGHMILIALAPSMTRQASRKGASAGDWLIQLRNRGAAKANAVYYCARHASLCRVTHPRA
ncbi:hypothetical protein [Candidatus Burkholderia verschuerenii]|uniref:hypothetical protein n=1 Tax=Candidatus Burkholderia verschuerenii TaxID=242163 RepID=UPI0012ECD332|nr:hypothetical protein [Candidatus Burkholderia verschuerenii]